MADLLRINLTTRFTFMLKIKNFNISETVQFRQNYQIFMFIPRKTEANKGLGQNSVTSVTVTILFLVFLVFLNIEKKFVFQTDLYILLSSDTIYDVSKRTDSNRKLKEEDGVRPTDSEDRQLLKNSHPFGDMKFACEEELKEQGKNGGLPYVILRVPDIIGPRDSTHRWWMYQLWLKVQKEFPEEPIVYPDYMENFNISFVYSRDVAEVMIKLVKKDLVVDNEIFNLAWEETITLRKLFTDMCNELGVPGPNIKVVDQYDQRGHTYRYPAARRGPLDVNKAKDKLQWKPTPWKMVVQKTITFFEEAMKSETFFHQMNEVIQVVETSALRNSNKTKFYEILEAMYGIKLDHFKPMHDEL